MRVGLICLIVVVVLIALLAIGYAGWSGWRLANTLNLVNRYPLVPYNAINFETGDLILFCPGISRMPFAAVDMLQMLMTNSPVTHVGMVVRDPNTNLLRCWELTWSEKFPSLIKFTNLHFRLKKYKGTVLVRRLISSPQVSDNQIAAARRSIYDFAVQTIKTPPARYRRTFYLNSYDHFVGFIHPVLPLDHTVPLEREWICTDIIIQCLHTAGVLTTTTSHLWPCDMSSMSKKQNVSALMAAEWSYGWEVRLVN